MSSGTPWGFLAGNGKDYEHAGALLEVSLRRQIGDPRAIAIVLLDLGNFLCGRSETSEARGAYVECPLLDCDLEERTEIAGAPDDVADMARPEANSLQVARFFGAALALREATGIQFALTEQTRHERQILLAKITEGVAAFDSDVAGGKPLTLDEICAEATDQ